MGAAKLGHLISFNALQRQTIVDLAMILVAAVARAISFNVLHRQSIFDLAKIVLAAAGRCKANTFYFFEYVALSKKVNVAMIVPAEGRCSKANTCPFLMCCTVKA